LAASVRPDPGSKLIRVGEFALSSEAFAHGDPPTGGLAEGEAAPAELTGRYER
jgi:hypothetical protein